MAGAAGTPLGLADGVAGAVGTDGAPEATGAGAVCCADASEIVAYATAAARAAIVAARRIGLAQFHGHAYGYAAPVGGGCDEDEIGRHAARDERDGR